MTHTLFAYGVLMYPQALQLLTGKQLSIEPASLPDHQRYTLTMPGWFDLAVVVPEPGSCVQGVLIRDIDADSLAVFDDFEDAGVDLYCRGAADAITNNGERVEAGVYLGGTVANQHLAAIWDEQTFIGRHYDNYIEKIIPQFIRERNQARG